MARSLLRGSRSLAGFFVLIITLSMCPQSHASSNELIDAYRSAFKKNMKHYLNKRLSKYIANAPIPTLSKKIVKTLLREVNLYLDNDISSLFAGAKSVEEVKDRLIAVGFVKLKQKLTSFIHKKLRHYIKKALKKAKMGKDARQAALAFIDIGLVIGIRKITNGVFRKLEKKMLKLPNSKPSSPQISKSADKTAQKESITAETSKKAPAGGSSSSDKPEPSFSECVFIIKVPTKKPNKEPWDTSAGKPDITGEVTLGSDKKSINLAENTTIIQVSFSKVTSEPKKFMMHLMDQDDSESEVIVNAILKWNGAATGKQKLKRTLVSWSCSK